MIKADFHTHSTYCDGKNTLEEMLDAAIDKKMAAIGFSGHSHTSFDESYCMSKEDTEKYIRDILLMKKRNKEDIEIYLGIEKDRFTDMTEFDRFDYVIGSVHYVLKDGYYIPVDESADVFKENIEKYYGGDYYAFCEDYYELLSSIADDSSVSIIGHFDLVTKFNENDCIFDTSDKRYISAVNEAIYRLAANGKILEINTGAISRGYRKEPYPSEDILVKWRKLGGKIIFSGDAHSTEGLCYAFENARKTAEKCGFKKACILKNNEFIEISL